MSDLFGDTTSTGPDTGFDSELGYNYATPSDAVANQDPFTDLGQFDNSQGYLYPGADIFTPTIQPQGLFFPTGPGESITPNSASQANPDFFSSLFSNGGQALGTAASSFASSFGQIFGNLAARQVAPLSQGPTPVPYTQNINTARTPNAMGIFSNPLVLIGIVVVVILLAKD